MRNIIVFFILTTVTIQLSAQTTITVMDSIIFYDGYAKKDTTKIPPAGVIMHKNSLYAKKLTTSQIKSIGTSLQMNVIISALCDNYDRIGNVNLALVPIGSTSYTPSKVTRIEIARFITPFFNKNRRPDTVPYVYNISNITLLLKDESLNIKYDFWIELEVFGVPYAANTQVAGCSGRNDVFMGKLEFLTNSTPQTQNTTTLLPLFFKSNLNNYQAKGTDTIGKTTKSITFNLPNKLNDVSFYLITSNHGANQGGEEYNRRNHFVYLDNELKLTYKPGRTSCEPYRKYNTQGNGIYGNVPRTPAQWQSFSNWCPGDIIDIREIKLGTLSSGEHTFLINVPDAIFKDKKGNIPLSLYLQGTPVWALGLNNKIQSNNILSIYPNPANGNFTIDLSTTEGDLVITDIHGKQIINTQITAKTSNFRIEKSGIYFISITTNQGIVTRKLIVTN